MIYICSICLNISKLTPLKARFFTFSTFAKLHHGRRIILEAPQKEKRKTYFHLQDSQSQFKCNDLKENVVFMSSIKSLPRPNPQPTPSSFTPLHSPPTRHRDPYAEVFAFCTSN